MGNKKYKLLMFGVGPIYGGIIIALTIAAVFVRSLPIFVFGRLTAIGTPLMTIGILLILLGVFTLVHANFISKIDDGINNCRLVTTGIYAWVRNSIYSAIMIACIGVILIVGNVCFFILPFVYRLLMIVSLKATEEKWLREIFAQECEDYCKRVNRCISWRRYK